MKAAVLLAPLLGGWLAVKLWQPGEGRRALPEPLSLSVGALAGLGASSLLCWLWLRVFGAYNHGLAALEAAILAGLIYAAWRRRADWQWWVKGNGGLFAWAAVAPPLALVLAVFALQTGIEPHGGWDAWSIWNLRARFLYCGGERWIDGLSGEIRWSHTDYPMLLPCLVARCWLMTGDHGQWAPAAAHLIFTVALVITLFSGLLELRGPATAVLAVFALAGGVSLGRYGASQYADVPLAAYMITALVLLSLDGGSPSLAGAAAGLAAWTKNEGVLFLASAAAVVWLVEGRKRLPAYFTAAGPLIMAIAMHKLGTGLPGDFMGAKPTVWERLTTTGRYWTILKAMAAQWWRPAEPWTSPAAFLGLLIAARGLGKASASSPATRIAGFVFLAMTVLYGMAFVMSTRNLPLHLLGAADRLFVQLWPLAVLAAALATKRPE